MRRARVADPTEAVGGPDRHLWHWDAWELADAVRSGECSASEILDVHLDRIQRLDGRLNSVCFLDLAAARERARAVDAAVAAGRDPGPLAGVPMGVKELASVEGWPETHASVVYADAVAAHDDTEVARLRAAGAVLVGPDHRVRTRDRQLHEHTAARSHSQPVGPRSGHRAGPRVVRPRPSPRGCSLRVPAATAAARSASRRRTAGCSA